MVSFVLLTGVSLGSWSLLAACYSLLGLRFLFPIVFLILSACFSIEEVDFNLVSIFIEFFVRKQIVNLSFMVFHIISTTGYSNTVLVLEGIIFAVMVESAFGYTIVFGSVDWWWGSFQSSEVLDMIHEGLLDIWIEEKLF